MNKRIREILCGVGLAAILSSAWVMTYGDVAPHSAQSYLWMALAALGGFLMLRIRYLDEAEYLRTHPMEKVFVAFYVDPRRPNFNELVGVYRDFNRMVATLAAPEKQFPGWDHPYSVKAPTGYFFHSVLLEDWESNQSTGSNIINIKGESIWQ